MKNSKTFYRSALATAVIMALSGPAMADSVTALTKENPTLSADVTHVSASKDTIAVKAVEDNSSVSTNGKNITATGGARQAGCYLFYHEHNFPGDVPVCACRCGERA